MWTTRITPVAASVLILAMTSVTATAGLLVDSSFEGSRWESGGRTFVEGSARWRTSGNKPTLASGNAPVCSGKQSVKIDLKKNASNNYRTEFRLQGPGAVTQLKFEQEYWIGFGIFIPNEWENDADDDIVFQLHGTPDQNLGEKWRSPPLSLALLDGHWALKVRTDTKQITAKTGQKGQPTTGFHYKHLKRVTKGQWTTVVFNLKVNPAANKGFVTMWIDDKKVVNHTKGFGYNDRLGPYAKIGNYKPKWITLKNRGELHKSRVNARMHYFDEFRVGDARSSQADVTPRCGNRGGNGSGKSASSSVPAKPTGLTLSVQ